MAVSLFLLATLVTFLASPSQQRHVSRALMDMGGIQDMLDDMGDEIISHRGLLPTAGVAGGAERRQEVGGANGVYDLDRTDRMLVQEEEAQAGLPLDDIPHPKYVHNWGGHLGHLGQVTAVSVNQNDEPVIFHRGTVEWNKMSFDRQHRLTRRQLISNDTILSLDPDTGEVTSSWGKDLFYMPHGLTVDLNGNTYVTDVGLHQVMRFGPGSETADVVLGEPFVPGSDETHFCQPTSVAVSDNTGTFFVADGYCNSRILKFNRDGNLTKIINGQWQVAHSLALFEDDDVLCVTSRDDGRIDCLRAGLDSPANRPDLDVTGQNVISYSGVGRAYAIAAKGTTLLSVNWEPEVRGITIDTAADTPAILDKWGNNGELSQPHDLSISLKGDSVYVVEIDPRKKENVHKFEVIREQERDENDDMFENEDF